MMDDEKRNHMIQKERNKMLPYIIIHNEMSLDGRFDWMADDQGLYYETIYRIQVDAMLSGSNTMLEAQNNIGNNTFKQEFTPAAKDFSDTRQLLVVVDSRGCIKDWSVLRNQPYWRDVVVLCSNETPRDHLEGLREQKVETIIAGDHHVDLHKCLSMLRAEYGVSKLRVDSGGILNGVLLRAGLVNEVVIILNPCLTGGRSPRTFYVADDLDARDEIIALDLKKVEELRDGFLWLQYEVAPVQGKTKKIPEITSVGSD
jgi:2,5-diamino-6-(ribosylamino)-4(3H)-pyrimidinone 5'-phosphate reductase